MSETYTVLWAQPARVDIKSLIRFLIDQDGGVMEAERHYLALREAGESLVRLPERGRLGQVDNTRELVMRRLPYLLVYRVQGRQVEILRVMHTSREPLQ